MKKFIFAVSLLMLGFTVSAHAQDGEPGACCVSNSTTFSQAAPLGNGQPDLCCIITDQSTCENSGGVFHGDNTDCTACCPTVSAGKDQTICAGDNATLTGEVTGVYGSLKWTTSGDGSFAPDTELNTTYTPGLNDIAAGGITLTLTASVPACPDQPPVARKATDIACSSSSVLKVTIKPLPDCTITLDPDAASGSVQAGSQHTASVPLAGLGASYQWVVKDENGNNLITADNGNSVIWTAPQHAAKVWINVKVTDAYGCSCEYDPPIDGQDKGIPVLVQLNVPALSGWGTAIFALLLTGLAVAVFRRKKAGQRG